MDFLSGDDEGLMAQATFALSHVDGVSDSVRARELYKYYQPSAPINADACFVAPSVSSPSDPIEPDRDIAVKSSVTSSKVSSPDTALTAFCQLTTWRTGAQRAMISLIDAETQYFIAESTRTVDLNDANKHAPGDEIWMGCSSVTKAGRLCEKTISVSPTTDGAYPCFVVNDLTKDERFCELLFVVEPPHLRFYAGVPLITRRGIPIGSLFVVDDRVGNGWTSEKTHFMATMAKTIIQHLEMVREVEEHRRGMKMSRGLASFVEGRAELVEAEPEALGETEGSKIAGKFEDSLSVQPIRKNRSARSSVTSSVKSATATIRTEQEYSAAMVKTEEALLALSAQHVSNIETVRPDLEEHSQPNSYSSVSVDVSSPLGGTNDNSSAPTGDHLSETSSMKMLFSRAANLIREAFEVDGGAIFYDAQTGFSSDMGRNSSADDLRPVIFRDDILDSPGDSLASDTELTSSGEYRDEEVRADIISPKLAPAANNSPGGGIFSRTMTADNKNLKKTAEILGFSTPYASSMHNDPLPGPVSFSPFGEKSLVTLLKRYPRGKLWTFDSDGAVSSSSEEDRARSRKEPIRSDKGIRRHKLRRCKSKSDAKFLSRHFPGVRQLLFVPLWDAGRSRWLSGCFAWSTEPTRILSKQSELAFLTAFGNSVMAEWARIDTEIADQKKGDFIGSISHELRSPLHGILASAEFLDEMTEGRTKQLVETIDSCGRTLLDTINHILDYSKINHFERNWRKTKKSGAAAPGSKSGPLALRQSDLPMLNLFQDINLSVLCEEVVDSVFAGSVYQNTTAQNFDMVSAQRMSDVKADEITGPQQFQSASVAVILDIDLQDYHFITQPGALRRLIMNLLGNSLKYTSHGYVRISLDSKEMEDLPSSGGQDGVARSMVTLTVTDTGKGISPEFLRSKLFMPFAQENSLSSGTGLGLSIVRKIVALLEGEITIDSEVGRGTHVQVKLPLLRELPKTADSTTSASTNSAVSTLKDVDQSITSLRARVAGQKACLQGFDVGSKDPVLRRMGSILKASITTFLVKWYGLRIVSMDNNPDFIICNEASPSSIKALLRKLGGSRKKLPTIISLCSHNSRLDRTFDMDAIDCNLSFVAKPVGPLKLAKTITHCLGAAPAVVTPGDKAPMQSESTDLSTMFEELMMSPRGGEVLDNTRMSAVSANARKALETPTSNAVEEKDPEFPFPNLIDSTVPIPIAVSGHARQISIEKVLDVPEMVSLATLKIVTPKKKAVVKAVEKVKFPALLVVDDNHINLSLLSTYLNRRKYETIHEAQNGLEAVQQVEKRPQGYDIIFMDITMPILDGFGATRQIRAMEEKRRRQSVVDLKALGHDGSADGMGEGCASPALIIAFTGRSSIEDQTEAVRSGIDLFMTKPVAFKEVGKIIDNWLANRERGVEREERRGTVAR